LFCVVGYGATIFHPSIGGGGGRADWGTSAINEAIMAGPGTAALFRA